ncbi:MAG: hypothetical protein AB7O04_04610 [Hyphomonadaceae bacterium]
MKFFVPKAKDDAMAEAIYEAIAKYIEAPILPRTQRISSLRWKHRDHEHVVVVGYNTDPRTKGEPVFAIFKQGANYAICTQNNGVANGRPIVAMGEEVSEVKLFTH